MRGEARPKKHFKRYPTGYVHIDIAEVRTEVDKVYLFVAIDRTSNVANAERHERATQKVAGAFRRAVIAALHYRVHTVLTDNGVQCTNQSSDRYAFRTRFRRACREREIDPRLTNPNHPWMNGQVEPLDYERMNRTQKEATMTRYHYGSHAELREHLSSYLLAYNHAKRLKTLRDLTPYEFVCAEWEKSPERFVRNPADDTLRPYT